MKQSPKLRKKNEENISKAEKTIAELERKKYRTNIFKINIYFTGF